LPNFEKIKAKTIANTPIPRLGREEDIANAVIFLASERASWITGEVLHVTGGRYSN
jgi:3-oxoacyl-[acyl-carrier protein] reductase